MDWVNGRLVPNISSWMEVYYNALLVLYIDSRGFTQ